MWGRFIDVQWQFSKIEIASGNVLKRSERHHLRVKAHPFENVFWACFPT
jgi:hypothetical protein